VLRSDRREGNRGVGSGGVAGTQAGADLVTGLGVLGRGAGVPMTSVPAMVTCHPGLDRRAGVQQWRQLAADRRGGEQQQGGKPATQVRTGHHGLEPNGRSGAATALETTQGSLSNSTAIRNTAAATGRFTSSFT